MWFLVNIVDYIVFMVYLDNYFLKVFDDFVFSMWRDRESVYVIGVLIGMKLVYVITLVLFWEEDRIKISIIYFI